MGNVAWIDADTYPKQSGYVGMKVRVCFHFDTSRLFDGIVLRDDKTKPFTMLILLEDGRVVEANECQWQSSGSHFDSPPNQARVAEIARAALAKAAVLME